MSPKTTRRGWDPSDALGFSSASMPILTRALEDVVWLLDRDYNLKPVLELVGGHYQLTARQRAALQRAAATQVQCLQRKSKQLPMVPEPPISLNIDGFNLIILLEVALSGSPLILGRDGVLRDLAGLRGTYCLLDKTTQALELVGRALNEVRPPQTVFFLDAPVSNSGRLRQKLLETSLAWSTPVEVHLVKDADKALAGLNGVVSGDSEVLEACVSWVNLGRWMVEKWIPEAWIVDLQGASRALD